MRVIKPPDVYLKSTGDSKGRGVFADRDFNKGEIVEAAPVILVTITEIQNSPEIKRRTFNWGKLTDRSIQLEALALGYGAMYNHANPANMTYRADTENNTLVFTTAKTIQKDEELTINYNAIGGDVTTSSEDHWFRRHKIAPV